MGYERIKRENRLGCNQAGVLRMIIKSGGWRDCPEDYVWTWFTLSETRRICESLVRKGLVTKSTSGSAPLYTATNEVLEAISGKTSPTFRPDAKAATDVAINDGLGINMLGVLRCMIASRHWSRSKANWVWSTAENTESILSALEKRGYVTSRGAGEHRVFALAESFLERCRW